MFSYRNDPGTAGVGIAFFDAAAANGVRMDLSVGDASRRQVADWDAAEFSLGLRIHTVRQVHGDRVLAVNRDTDVAALALRPGDALITTARGVGLGVRVADCLPVLFADPSAGVVGAAHAGRVGLAAGVLVRTVVRLGELGATDLQAWIGPHICGGCYEVPASLQAEFTVQHPAAAATTSWGTPSLDLGAAAEAQLETLGCAVTRVDPCTFTTPTLHSYRRDGERSGRQLGVVWLP